MFCNECGKKINTNVKFCSNCGTKLMDEPPLEELKVAGNSSYSTADGQQKFTEELINSKYFDELIVDNVEYYRSRFINLIKPIREYAEYYENFRGMPASEVSKKILNRKKIFFWFDEQEYEVLKASKINWVALFFAPYWLAYRKMYVPAVIYFIVDFLMNSIGSPIIAIIWMANSIIAAFGANAFYFYSLERSLKKNISIDLKKVGGVDPLAMYLSILLTLVFFITNYLINRHS